MATQFRHLEIDTGPGEQRRDFRSQSASGRVRLIHGATEDVAYFLFHAPSIAPGAALQAGLHTVFNVTDYKLCHPLSYLP